MSPPNYEQSRKPVRFVRLHDFDHLDAVPLLSIFNVLNATFFRGRLPYRVIYGRPPGDARAASGYCDPGARTIYVNPSPPTPDAVRRILLHEMCHIGSIGHGKRFQAKLRGLGAMGEAWAVEEAEQCASEIRNRQPVTASIARAIRKAAVDVAAHPWPAVEAVIAVELGLEVSSLRRTAPWAEGLWNRETRAKPPDPSAMKQT